MFTVCTSVENKYRRSTAQHILETQFTVLLGKLFDIAHADWENKTKLLADRQFLVDQRSDRLMSMSTEGKTFRKAVEKQAIRRKQSEQTRQAAASECCSHNQSEWTGYNLSDSENSETGDDFSKPYRQDSRNQDCL